MNGLLSTGYDSGSEAHLHKHYCAHNEVRHEHASSLRQQERMLVTCPVHWTPAQRAQSPDLFKLRHFRPLPDAKHIMTLREARTDAPC